MKALCINATLFSKDGLSLLEKSNIKVSFADNTNNINQYDILLIRPDSNLIGKITDDTNIKYIISVATGTNHLDTEFLKKNKIKLYYLRNKNFLNKVKATSEHTIFLILSALRKINKLANKYKDFKNKHVSNEIYGSKIGILGYGRVGKQVGKILKSFGAKIYIFEIGKKNFPKYINNCSSIKELFLKTEIITLHIPLIKKNYNLIDKKKINLLKNKILVNTSRAEIIEEIPLVEMIKKKQITYFTDVVHFEHEPFIHNKLAKIKSYDNLFITPHIAGITEESIRITDLYLINNFLNDQKN